jgi:RimJ/RimL family protein N-acetyltransferase
MALFTGLSQNEDFVLMTPRLCLRWPRLSDAENYCRYANDIRVAEQTARMPHPYLLEAAQQYITECRRKNAAGTAVTLVITKREAPDTVLGCTTYEQVDAAHDSSSGSAGSPPLPQDASSGTWLGVPLWSTGFGTETTRAVTRYLFTSSPRLRDINVWIRAENHGSIKMVLRSGFRFVSKGTVDAPARGGTLAVVWVVMSRSDWTAQNEGKPVLASL